MTRKEIKNTPEIVDFMLDKSVMADSRMKLHKRLKEICELATKILEQQPCDDAISRQAVIDIAKSSKSNWIDNSVLFKRVDELPSVNPQPKTGHWIYIANSKINGLKIVECSSCGRRTYGSGKYCPNCGAKMESEVKE